MFSNCLNECGRFKAKYLYRGVRTFWGFSGGVEVYTFVLKLTKKSTKIEPQEFEILKFENCKHQHN